MCIENYGTAGSTPRCSTAGQVFYPSRIEDRTEGPETELPCCHYSILLEKQFDADIHRQ
jgi:hypothetical protein